MPLATKNGSLIVKSGSIAENCNCCAGGWYCYCEDTCNTTPACSYCLGSCAPYKAPNTFTATITASDYISRVMGRVYFNNSGGFGNGVGCISYFKGSAIAGSHTMNRISATQYRVDLPSSSDCSSSSLGGSYLLFDMSQCSFTLRVRRLYESSLANFPADTPPKTVADLDCTSQSPASPFVANSQWIDRNNAGERGGNSTQTAQVFASCTQINSATPVSLSMTLPANWWSEGNYTGFGFSTSNPNLPGVVYEQSGGLNRIISASFTPNY